MLPTMSDVTVAEPALLALPPDAAAAVPPEVPAEAPLPDVLPDGIVTTDAPGPPGPPLVDGPSDPPHATPIDDPMTRATTLPYELRLFIAQAP
jgi:hypothetical protein